MGWVKLSIDGSFCAMDNSAGAGSILRDAQGHPVFSACRHMVLCVLPLEVELQACLDGLEKPLQFSQAPIIVKSDCLQLIEAMKSRSPDRSLFCHLVSVIKNLARRDRVCFHTKNFYIYYFPLKIALQ